MILATLMKKCLHLQQQQEIDSSNHYLDAITTTVKMILSDRWGEIGITMKQIFNLLITVIIKHVYLGISCRRL